MHPGVHSDLCVRERERGGGGRRENVEILSPSVCVATRSECTRIIATMIGLCTPREVFDVASNEMYPKKFLTDVIENHGSFVADKTDCRDFGKNRYIFRLTIAQWS